MPQLVIEVLGDASNLERTFRRVGRQTESFGQKIGRFAKVGVFAGATAGVVGLTAAFKVGFDELAEGQKVAAQTNAALKSTGAVAGVTAGHVDQLAKSIQAYSGADDEAVQSAENLLLTFSNIRNQVGQGNDVFDQTTRAVADLSQALGQDLQSSALQLGKALNDPVRGITALRRVGISFTAAQVKLITKLSQTGRTLEAQKLILKEVNREVGGSAKAFGDTLPGKIQILRGSLENLAGDLVETLAPAITDVVDRFNKWLANPENKRKIMDSWRTGISLIGKAAAGAAKGFQTLAEAGDSLGGALFKVVDWINGGDFKRALDVLEHINNIKGRIHVAGADFSGAADAVTAIAKQQNAGMASVVKALKDADLAGAVKKEAAATAGTGVTAEQRNRWFDAMIGRELDRVQDIPTLRRQISRLKEIARLVTDRIAVTKDITRKLTLGDTLRDITRQIADDQKEVAQNAKDAAKAAKEAHAAAVRALSDWVKSVNAIAEARNKALGEDFLRRKKANEERKKRQQEQDRRDATAAQFSVLGLGPTGQEIITRKGLAAQLKRIREDIKGTTLNTDKTRARLKAIYSVIVSGVHGMSREVRETVKSMLDDIDQQLADAPKKKKPRRRMVGGIWVDAYGNAIGAGLPSGRNNFYDPYTAVNKFTGAVKDATAALNTLDKLRIFADLRQFGGNLWSRAGVAALGGMGGGGMAGNRLQMPRVNMWGTGRPDTSGIFAGGGRHFSGVIVNQHFNAPTTDRHREARYALAATRAVFDT